ncbi:hypothetical protein CUJ83_02005 [Methanocella sp. CWC-04]|uniref:Uncharacterized protein n=1 Tax=Methanooceanicella nereidis TaxID=2052831 RepID=A0AAP2RAV8_9EURY|nr:DUF5788 family protein [Methanocella sp. CWC-04]MCD1293769.1 hypothetical protein [Methanocella sp. CWC-04]
MNEKWDPEYCPGCYPGIHHGGMLTEEERRHLEFKLTRLLEWVGAWIPGDVTVDNKKIPLHEIVWDLMNKDDLTDEDKELLTDLEYKLEKKFHQDVERIRESDKTEDEAIRDYCEALGLLRAIITLKDIAASPESIIGHGDLSRRINERRKNEANAWLNYLKQIL